MHFTSLELSQQLYEVSKWFDPAGKEFPVLIGNTVGYARQYTLGFLLRKLPDYVKLFRNNKGLYYCAAVTGGFRHPDNRLGMPDTAHEWYTADIPEDAAAKLCLVLFKQNILKKETN